MPKLVIPQGSTFLGLMGIVEEYMYPFRSMWPAIWLKAAAVREKDEWRLCYFSLSGRFHDDEPTDLLLEQYTSIIAICRKLDIEETYELLSSLVERAGITLAPAIFAASPDLPIANSAIWQDRNTIPPLETVQDVIESPIWWYLYIHYNRTWLDDYSRRDQIAQLVRDDLNKLGEQSFEAFIASRFAHDRNLQTSYLSFENLNYHIDLPLALDMNPGTSNPETKMKHWQIECRTPLQLDDIAITPIVTSVSNNAQLHAEIESSGNGWDFGNIEIPALTQRITLRSAHLEKALHYDIELPSRETLMKGVVSFLYDSNKPMKGLSKWEQDLLGGKGPDFEIALINAFSRIGIPVLFAGAITQNGETGGTATPGLDLIAIDYSQRKTVAISAKGASLFPTTTVINELNEGVQSIRLLLPGWTVWGVVICHAESSKLRQFASRNDVFVWGQENIEYLLVVDSPMMMKYYFWNPPWQVDPLASFYSKLPR